MAIIYSYPTATPQSSDNLLGTQYDATTEENKTVQFSIANVNSLGTSNFLEATVTITNAQWLALNATPVTLITAPGANKAIKVLAASAFFDYSTPSFTWTADVNISVNSVNLAVVPNSLSAVNADLVYSCDSPAGGILATNTALVATGGGTTAGGGSLQIKVRHQILDISSTTSF